MGPFIFVLFVFLICGQMNRHIVTVFMESTSQIATLWRIYSRYIYRNIGEICLKSLVKVKWLYPDFYLGLYRYFQQDYTVFMHRFIHSMA